MFSISSPRSALRLKQAYTISIHIWEVIIYFRSSKQKQLKQYYEIKVANKTTAKFNNIVLNLRKSSDNKTVAKCESDALKPMVSTLYATSWAFVSSHWAIKNRYRSWRAFNFIIAFKLIRTLKVDGHYAF